MNNVLSRLKILSVTAGLILVIFSVVAGFAPDAAAAGQLPSLGGLPSSGQVGQEAASATTMSRIVIAAIGVDTAVVNAPRTQVSWDVSQLGWRVGHLQGTANPGEGGNVVLGGHRYLGTNYNQAMQPGPFVGLNNLYSGAEVELYAGGNVYTYQVTEVFRVERTDVWVVGPTGQETLTLLSCDTWDPVNQRFSKRLVVRARLVSVEPIS